MTCSSSVGVAMLQRLGCWLGLVAASLLLQSCAPSADDVSAASTEKMFRQVIAEISPAIYAKVGSSPAAGSRNQSVALVFLDGVPPPTATCAADLKAGLEKQLSALAARAHIRLRMTSNVDDAAAAIVIGDTLRESRRRDSPLETLMNAARQRTGAATSTFDWDFGVPGHPSPDYLEGLFANSNDRLIFGVSRIHWSATYRDVGSKACAFNFVARLAWLYPLALHEEFRGKYWAAERALGIGGDARYVLSPPIERILGVYFCAQFVGAEELVECSAQVLKLMKDDAR